MNRFSSHFVLRLGLGLLLWVHAPRAFAEGELASDQAAAHVQFERALDLSQVRDFEGAKRILMDLWSRYKTYDVASELGRAEFQLGDMAASAKYTAFALAHLPPHEQADTEKLHQNRLSRALAKIQRYGLAISPPGAALTVDGIAYDVPSSIGLFLAPGTHTLTISKEGYEPSSRTVDAKESASDALTIELAKVAQPSVQLAPTPPPMLDNSPLPPPPPEDKPWVVLAVGGSLTAIALGGGVYFHVRGADFESKANAKADVLAESGGCTMSPVSSDCAALSRDLSDRNDSYKTAKVLYVTGAALGAATAVLTWALWPSTQATQLGAWATPNGAGLAAGSRF